MSMIIPEAQKDGVRQRLLVFLEEPDLAVCRFPFNTAQILFGQTNSRLLDLNYHFSSR